MLKFSFSAPSGSSSITANRQLKGDGRTDGRSGASGRSVNVELQWMDALTKSAPTPVRKEASRCVSLPADLSQAKRGSYVQHHTLPYSVKDPYECATRGYYSYRGGVEGWSQSAR